MNRFTLLGLIVSTFYLLSCKAGNSPANVDSPLEDEVVEVNKKCPICEAHPDNLKHVRVWRKEYHQLTGAIRSDITLVADEKWLLKGAVTVEAGATLTIEPGTIVHAKHGDGRKTSYLSIQRDGKIDARGNAEKPIVFTSIRKHPFQGDWGGIILNGKAPVQNNEEAFGEGGSGPFGGDDPNDSSGSLSYVRVEYAGEKITQDDRMNGFSFYGCGTKTQLDHLQAFHCKDDGFEFVGGTARLKYALATACGDDGFDYSKGWCGKGQFWVVHQTEEDGDRGIEGDNNKKTNDQMPISNPQIANITLIGCDDGDGKNQGIKVRAGTKGQFVNAIIAGFPKYAVYVENDRTIAHLLDGSLSIRSFIIHSKKGVKYKDDKDESLDLETGIEMASNKNTFEETNKAPDFLNGFVGIAMKNAANPIDLDSWFTAATYIGAVDPANDWTLGWVRSR